MYGHQRWSGADPQGWFCIPGRRCGCYCVHSSQGQWFLQKDRYRRRQGTYCHDRRWRNHCLLSGKKTFRSRHPYQDHRSGSRPLWASERAASQGFHHLRRRYGWTSSDTGGFGERRCFCCADRAGWGKYPPVTVCETDFPCKGSHQDQPYQLQWGLKWYQAGYDLLSTPGDCRYDH